MFVRVRSLLSTGSVGYDLATVAQALHLSPRTLRRRLQDHGATFHAMVSEARRDEATRLLRNSVLTVEQIAGHLGYSDPGNFCRAFKRWTGLTPGSFRASHVTDSSRAPLG